jgi:hypothetical protein
MKNGESEFERAVNLYKTINKSILPNGTTLRASLMIDEDVSLLDTVATYLILYRFPLLFKPNNSTSEISFKSLLRPTIGKLAHWKENFFNPTHITDLSCCNWPSNKRPVILLPVFTTNHYRDVLAPVMNILHETCRVDSVRVDLTGELNCNEVNFEYRHQSIWQHYNLNVQEYFALMTRKINSVKSFILNIKTIKAMVGSEWELSTLALRAELNWLFEREFPRLIKHAAIAKHILTIHRPNLIISADDADQRSRLYSQFGKKLNIETIVIQQGLTHIDYPEWHNFLGSKVACIGENSRKAMEAQGIANNKIIITGHPGFDKLGNKDRFEVANLRAEFQVTDLKKMILFASQPYYPKAFSSESIRIKMIQSIRDAVSTYSDAILVVKPHPMDNINELKFIFKNNSNIWLCDAKRDINPLIRSCDTFITMFSTTTLQALYAGKPTINVDFYGSNTYSPFPESGATWVARSVKEIKNYLQFCLGHSCVNETVKKTMNESRDKILTDFLYLQDGMAAQRAANIIMEALPTRC